MERFRNTYMVIIFLVVVTVVMGLMFAHDTCHFDNTAMCFLSVCAFILTAAGFGILLAGKPLLIKLPAESGVSLKFRLERPPRS